MCQCPCVLVFRGWGAQPLLSKCSVTRNISTAQILSRSGLPASPQIARDMCESSCMMYGTASGHISVRFALRTLRGWYKSSCSSFKCSIIFCPVHAAQSSCIKKPPTLLQLVAPSKPSSQGDLLRIMLRSILCVFFLHHQCAWHACCTLVGCARPSLASVSIYRLISMYVQWLSTSWQVLVQVATIALVDLSI